MVNGAPVGLDSRSRSVGGQFKYWRLAGQLLTPVMPEAFAFGTCERPGLPVGVVDVSFRGWRKRVGTVLGGVQQAELVKDDVDGPEVDGDVMYHQQEHMFVSCAL